MKIAGFHTIVVAKNFGDGEAQLTGYLINQPLSSDEIDSVRAELGSHYGGPGCIFCKPASVRTTKRRTLFTQLSGLDI